MVAPPKRVVRRSLCAACAVAAVVVSALVLVGPLARPDGSVGEFGSAVDIDARLDEERLASPHASLVVAALPTTGQLVAYDKPNEDAAKAGAFDVRPDDPAHFLATNGYRELQNGWNSLTREGKWLEIHLPIRPNGSTGWVRLVDVELYQNRYKIRVDRERFTLEVFSDGELILETEVAIGTGATPTPVGTFFTEQLLQVPDPGGPYGPFAFVLSGHSDHLLSFNGGPGLIGIHGTNDPASLGSDVSHGCIRVDNAVISDLAEFIPLATPIEII